MKRPVGRPRKVITAEEKLAKLTVAERADLLDYSDEVAGKTNNDGRYHQGDVREDGKVFLWYRAVWATPAQYERVRASNRQKALAYYYKTKSEAANVSLAITESTIAELENIEV